MVLRMAHGRVDLQTGEVMPFTRHGDVFVSDGERTHSDCVLAWDSDEDEQAMETLDLMRIPAALKRCDARLIGSCKRNHTT